jgi:hypothetical protein
MFYTEEVLVATVRTSTILAIESQASLSHQETVTPYATLERLPHFFGGNASAKERKRTSDIE